MAIHDPVLSEHTDWRVPHPTRQYDAVLAKVPHNGQWYVVRSKSGFTVSEQQARMMNSCPGEWEWGHRVYAVDGTTLVSDLAVRWVGRR